ncbi:MAG: TlpA disulfide reductase family protein [Myxococcota bacterium]|nr:TlpA disulfide reductase family protein [Myxococcota bacterium]
MASITVCLKRQLFMLAVSLFILACGTAQDRNRARLTTQAQGQKAKTVDFTLEDLDKNIIHLADHRDSIVLVTYFTTWCAPCAELLPLLNTLASGPEALSNVVVIGISVDLQPKRLLPTFIESWEINFPVAIADRAMLHGRTPFGQLVAVPSTHLIDPNGYEVGRFVGAVPMTHLRQKLESLGAKR